MGVTISVLLLLSIAIWQYIEYRKTKKLQEEFRNIFPLDPNKVLGSVFDEEKNALQIRLYSSNQHSKIFKEVVNDINHYLEKNTGSTDFAILKDITDRHSDTVEEQIQATSPFPIYIGLCGTLVGIVYGVSVLGFGGGLEALLSTTEDVSQGAEGIADLLRGVGVAMGTTLFGVLLTIIGSHKYKNANTANERRKNLFLSWMQGELLPKMNDSMAKTLDVLQQNLNQFNRDFSENSRNLSDIFSKINTTYEGQADVLRLIERLDLNNLATQNIRILRALQGCTNELGTLKEFVEKSNAYLSAVTRLNVGLDKHLDRTQLIEKMGEFFRDEIEQVKYRKAAISQTVAEIDSALQQSMEDLSKHAAKEYQDLLVVTTQNHSSFLEAIDEQKKALEVKLSETTQLIAELKNLTAVKGSMEKLVELSTIQNEQMKRLNRFDSFFESIQASNQKQNALLERLMQSIGNIAINAGHSNPIEPEGKSKKWISYSLFAMGALTSVTIIGTCVFYIIRTFL